MKEQKGKGINETSEHFFQRDVMLFISSTCDWIFAAEIASYNSALANKKTEAQQIKGA